MKHNNYLFTVTYWSQFLPVETSHGYTIKYYNMLCSDINKVTTIRHSSMTYYYISDIDSGLVLRRYRSTHDLKVAALGQVKSPLQGVHWFFISTDWFLRSLVFSRTIVNRIPDECTNIKYIMTTYLRDWYLKVWIC